ncbi:restriction endonuclease subunit S [Cupriavidus sp. USMAHM13]|uniref:restriction endonuclease subunit S n=1 Tax=Cupriavidus sp. USMAHM13 TaxID=1389192 RepID=UPI0009F2F973|nr:restriction endonuclease subunit S [Cupriavidus sp. USMAHM13]
MTPSIKLKPYITQVRGIAYKPDEIADTPFENSVPLLKANNITDDGLDSSSLIYIAADRIKSEQFIRAGDLLLAASSGSKKAIGKNVHFPEPFSGSFGAFCKIVRPKNGLYSGYLKHFFKTRYYRSSIEKAVQGANINNLRNEHLDDLEISLPPLNDQIRIAHLLGKVEGLIAQRKQHLQQLDDLLKSVFLEMFGDPVRNEKGWDKPELKAFGKISTGNTPPRNESANYDGDFIEWIKTDNITGNAVFVTSATEHLSEVGAKKARTVTSGALLVACIAGSVESIGRAALTDRTVSFNQQINAIQPGKDVNPLYLYGLFKLSRSYIQSHATKGMKKILTKGDFEKITMIKPPFEIQNRFAVTVEKVEGIKSRYKQSLADLETLYDALSQRAFRGQLDLSRVPMPKPPAQHIAPVTIGDQASVPEPVAQASPVIDLPASDKLPAALENAEARKALIAEWLEAYRQQLGDAPFSVQDFMVAVSDRLTEWLQTVVEDEAVADEQKNRLAEFYPSNDVGLDINDYEHIKKWVFEALAAGALTQRGNKVGNRIELTAVQS